MIIVSIIVLTVGIVLFNTRIAIPNTGAQVYTRKSASFAAAISRYIR
ncbi:MAG: hypothetical protein HYX39_01460 [Bacteroidetes bacterium]|nr:hypothetical protein [Bacteroidota bacterium]